MIDWNGLLFGIEGIAGLIVAGVIAVAILVVVYNRTFTYPKGEVGTSDGKKSSRAAFGQPYFGDKDRAPTMEALGEIAHVTAMAQIGLDPRGNRLLTGPRELSKEEIAEYLRDIQVIDTQFKRD